MSNGPSSLSEGSLHDEAGLRVPGRVLARLETQVALLGEELRIKDARMARIAPRARPHYPPCERLAILMLRAVAGWNAAETARRFLVTATTIASWVKRLDEGGEEALLRTAAPVNRFPD
jgi:predicted RNA polymerase sigma factor